MPPAPSVVFSDLNACPVVITGGASGIGAALVEGFLRQGSKVAFLDLADGEELARRLDSDVGARPLAIRCDVTDSEALRAGIAEAEAAHGPARVLVNNVADDARHATLDVTEAQWDALMSVNLKSYFFAAQAVIPGMRDAGGGRIVNLSSISYMMGQAGYPAYTSANAGITALTRALAREFGPDGIRVNALAPGWVMTEKQRALWASPEAVEAHLARQCLPTELMPGDMVEPALFLASDASRAITGQLLAADGGVVSTG